MPERKEIMMAVRLSEAEKKLLSKRAKAEKLSEADYIRLAVVMDSVLSGDLDGLKIVGSVMAEKVGGRLKTWRAQGVLTL